MDLMWLAIGIAVAAYFIGDGLKNFKNPTAPNIWDALDDDNEHQFIREKEVHHFIGISKEDVEAFVAQHNDIPHVVINEHTYFPKAKLRKWLKEFGG